MPGTADENALIKAAIEAASRAVAPYSNFQVGAALLVRGASGTALVTGANVESASYGLTCCAERIAVFKALSDGWRKIEAVAVAARLPNGPMPCGACRQILAEFAPDAPLWVVDINSPSMSRKFQVRDLLPEAFLDFRCSSQQAKPVQIKPPDGSENVSIPSGSSGRHLPRRKKA